MPPASFDTMKKPRSLRPGFFQVAWRKPTRDSLERTYMPFFFTSDVQTVIQISFRSNASEQFRM